MIPELGIGLGLWLGEFQGCTRQWIRFFDATDQWILTPLEQEQERADQEQIRAERERLRAERLAEALRAQGIDPDQIM